MKVKIGLSNHHVHLSKEDLNILFPNCQMEIVRELSQPGQFVTNLTVDVAVDDKKINKLKVLGPARDYTQVELLNSDCEYLQITCPTTSSGNLVEAGIVKIISPYAEIERKCAIIAERHLHITDEDLIKFNLKNNEKIKLIRNNRVIDDVYVKASANSFLEVHLDKEDGLNINVNNGDEFDVEKY